VPFDVGSQACRDFDREEIVDDEIRRAHRLNGWCSGVHRCLVLIRG
jgi:hypothetical protein